MSKNIMVTIKMHLFFIVIIIANCILFGLSCTDDNIPIPPDDNKDKKEGKVAVWRSDKQGLLKIVKEPELLPYEIINDYDVNVVIDDSIEYQEMEGFGASITGSSAYVIQTHLEESKQNELLKDLFNPIDGIGLSYIRLTIGASDFSLNDYTYNDLNLDETDIPQNLFSLSMEEEYLIPLLQKILSIRPDLKIMASPWSAPAWMKENENLRNGGHLKSDLRESYAEYFVKYIQEMAENNIPIHAITIQNEPLYAAPYMSMEMSAEEQKIFIRDFLGPHFETNNITTKIIVYDHNWDNIDYPMDILEDEDAKKFIEGTAFHCYAGDVSSMSLLHNAHPSRGIYFTECSGGDFAPDYAQNLSWNAENLIVGATRNWSKTVLFWNIALDQNNGPKNGGCENCRGVVTINSNTQSVTKNEEYVLLGHISKFLEPGAKRINTPNTRGQDISQVAFKNPNGAIVIVAFNHRNEQQKVQFNHGQDAFNYKIEGGMLATFLIEL